LSEKKNGSKQKYQRIKASENNFSHSGFGFRLTENSLSIYNTAEAGFVTENLAQNVNKAGAIIISFCQNYQDAFSASRAYCQNYDWTKFSGQSRSLFESKRDWYLRSIFCRKWSVVFYSIKHLRKI